MCILVIVRLVIINSNMISWIIMNSIYTSNNNNSNSAELRVQARQRGGRRWLSRRGLLGGSQYMDMYMYRLYNSYYIRS